MVDREPRERSCSYSSRGSMLRSGTASNREQQTYRFPRERNSKCESLFSHSHISLSRRAAELCQKSNNLYNLAIRKDAHAKLVPMEFYLPFRSSAFTPINCSHCIHARELLFFNIITRRRTLVCVKLKCKICSYYFN